LQDDAFQDGNKADSPQADILADPGQTRMFLGEGPAAAMKSEEEKETIQSFLGLFPIL
jgi:hypothetical protein